MKPNMVNFHGKPNLNSFSHRFGKEKPINVQIVNRMVAIIKEEPSLQDILNVYQCGGSLIHPSVSITVLIDERFNDVIMFN